MTKKNDSDSRTSAGGDMFATEHLRDDLRGRSVRGGAITVGSQVVIFVLNLVGIIVLARLLEPEDFGLFGMILAILNFLQLFSNVGLATATVQKEKISHEQVSTLFWCNAFLGLVIALAVAACSPLIAWFYGEPRLVPVTIVSAGGFFILSLTLQHRGLIRRQMRFGAQAAGEVAGRALGVTVGIVAGFLGFGYWSLVAMYVMTFVGMAGTFWIIFPWRPSRPVKGSGVREMLAFGGYLTGYRTFKRIAENVDKVLVGKVFSTATLGYYTRAYVILTQPIRYALAPVSNVAVSTLSRLVDEPQRYKRYYLRIVFLVTLVCAPAGAFFCGASNEIVATVLGQGWGPTGPILFWFGLAAAIQPTYEASNLLHITTDNNNRLFKWGMVETPLIFCAFLFGVFYSPRAVAGFYAAALWVMVLPAFWYAGRPMGLKIREVIAEVSRPLLAAGSAGVVTWFAGAEFFGGIGAVAGLVCKAIVFIIVYSVALICFYGGLEPFRLPVSLIKDLKQKQKKNG